MNKTKPDKSTPLDPLLASLYGRINYEQQNRVTPEHFKLRNMREILLRLGNPHGDYPIIHVAGTKGKGSVCTLLGQILTSTKRRTGVYTSPHLESIHQRMVVDGCPITNRQLADALSVLKPVVAEMDAEAESGQTRPLTFFEITTAAAFYHFSKQKCDVVVLEVGLGGRLDSTNVCSPIACIITNISVDHTLQLGSTVDKIAFEKAGIIKPKVPVVSGTLDPIAAEVIARTAAENQSPILVLDKDFSVTSDDHSRTFAYSADRVGDAPTCEIADLKLQLIGHHQQTNAAIAITTAEVLNRLGWQISKEHVRSGLENTVLLGRAELVCHEPIVIIDMAHNAASIVALVEAIKKDIPQWNTDCRRKLIFATSHDKDAEAMLRPLISCFDEIILTKYQNNPRGKCEQELQEIANAIKTDLNARSLPSACLSTVTNPDNAWTRISSNLEKSDLICITGSAFLVAELRPSIMESTRVNQLIS